MKFCRLCKLVLEDKAFVLDRSQPGGLLNRCRMCDSKTKRIRGQANRLIALCKYGGDPPFCACCKESRLEFLEIDHPNGGGTQHRLQVGNGAGFYRWLKRNGYPPGFRVLCSNCNSSMGKYGYCPHAKEIPVPMGMQVKGLDGEESSQF